MSEPAKVLIDREGFKWVLKDDGKYEWDKGYLRYSRDWLERIFGPLTERKEEVMSDVNMPEVLIDCAGDRWELLDNGYYSYGWGTLCLDMKTCRDVMAHLLNLGRGVCKSKKKRKYLSKHY